jgi:hypothetical protein
MEPNPPEVHPPAQAIFTSAPSGAFVTVRRTEREMTLYGFQEGELVTIGMYNHLLNIFIAIGGSAFGFVMSTILDLRLAALTDKARTNNDWGGISMGSLVLFVCIGLGVWAGRSRRSEVERIKSESRIIGGEH